MAKSFVSLPYCDHHTQDIGFAQVCNTHKDVTSATQPSTSCRDSGLASRLSNPSCPTKLLEMPEALLEALLVAKSQDHTAQKKRIRRTQSTSPRKMHDTMYISPFPPTSVSDQLGFMSHTLCPSREDFVVKDSYKAPSMGLPRHAYSWPSHAAGSPVPSSLHTPPMTPPEKDGFTWTTIPTTTGDNLTQASLSAETDPIRVDLPARHSSDRASDRPSAITLPVGNPFEQQQGPATWLDRALQKMHSITDMQKTCSELQVVVQAMPGHAGGSETGPKKTFEEVVARFQRLAVVPYVRITHAYTKRYDVSLKDAPISPPATPNIVGAQDYFDDWTICTNLARIPDYHSPIQDEHRNPRVTAPNRIHASILERHLPPTTPQEVRDFFALNKRSYLADRLNELHDGSDGPEGALLLVYPTNAGGKTFKTYYKDPVFDPMLRRFMMLRGLTTRALEALGKMDAVDTLMSFEDMQAAIESLCAGLGRHLLPVGRPSKFSVEHAEQTEVVLDRETWIDQFLAQETSRIRQDLVDYQKSGQRMPAQSFDASPAALAREVEEGIRSSNEAAGGVGIEVGVFVIRRSLI